MSRRLGLAPAGGQGTIRDWGMRGTWIQQAHHIRMPEGYWNEMLPSTGRLIAFLERGVHEERRSRG